MKTKELVKRLTAAFFNFYGREKVLNYIREKLIKPALKKFLNAKNIGGVKAWAIEFIVKELYDEIGEPLIKYGLNQAGYVYAKRQGKIIIEKMASATTSAEYDNYSDDLYNSRL